MWVVLGVAPRTEADQGSLAGGGVGRVESKEGKSLSPQPCREEAWGPLEAAVTAPLIQCPMGAGFKVVWGGEYLVCALGPWCKAPPPRPAKDQSSCL